jgi:predicted RNA-binding protein with PUA-like domain
MVDRKPSPRTTLASAKGRLALEPAPARYPHRPMAKSSSQGAGPRRYWLVKSEPGTFSFDDLWTSPKRRTGWEGVRNHQARNFMRDAMQVGDGVLFYHSSADPTGIAGLARVASEPYPDPTQFDARSPAYDARSTRAQPTWIQVDLEATRRLPRVLTLEELRREPRLASLQVLRRGQRLSVMPVTADEWERVLALAGVDEPAFRRR